MPAAGRRCRRCRLGKGAKQRPPPSTCKHTACGPAHAHAHAHAHTRTRRRSFESTSLVRVFFGFESPDDEPARPFLCVFSPFGPGEKTALHDDPRERCLLVAREEVRDHRAVRTLEYRPAAVNKHKSQKGQRSARLSDRRWRGGDPSLRHAPRPCGRGTHTVSRQWRTARGAVQLVHTVRYVTKYRTLYTRPGGGREAWGGGREAGARACPRPPQRRVARARPTAAIARCPAAAAAAWLPARGGLLRLGCWCVLLRAHQDVEPVLVPTPTPE